MSTPEDVAARLAECLDDEWAPLEGGMLRAPVPSWIIRTATAELAAQRATMERLERALEDAVTTLTEAANVCEPDLPSFSRVIRASADRGRAALSSTKASAAPTGEDRGDV